MAYAFDGHSFSGALSDVELLAKRALDHEQRLTELVTRVEQDEFSRANGLLGAIHDLCVDARDQRLLAERTRARLVGPTATDAQTETVTRPLVLVVDDSVDSRDLAAAVLDDAGFDAVTASNGLEAVIVAHYSLPVLVLMDITMPVLDGVEAARLLKASPSTRELPVIAYTAKPDFRGATSQLFSDVLAKPAHPQAIVAVARRFVVTGGDDAFSAT